MTLPNSDVVSYEYDGASRKAIVKLNGTIQYTFLYRDQYSPIAQFDGSGNLIARFVWGNNLVTPEYIIKSGTKYKLVTDPRGSVRLVIKTTDGTVAQRIDYDEWGYVTNDTSPGFQPFGYAGGLYDPLTGLVEFGARHYDGEFGRWLSKDPAFFGATDINLYGYVLQDPVNYIDQSGYDFRLPEDPSGLGPDWQKDKNFKHPHGEQYTDSSGRKLRYDRGQAGAKGWRGKNHWHDPQNFGRRHLPPGTSIPDPAPRVVPRPRVPITPYPGGNFPIPIPIIINPCLIDSTLPGCGCNTPTA